MDLNLHLTVEDQEVSVGDFDILARATSPTSWQLGLKANRVSTSSHVNLQNAGLNGSSFITIAENEFKVALMGFTIETLTQTVGLQGQWAFNTPIPSDNRLEIKLDGNLEGLKALTPSIDLGELSGKLTLDGEITGELANPQYAWTLSVQELNSRKLTIGDLRASGSGDLDALKISNLQMSGEMGSVDGEATIRFDGNQIETQLQTERFQVGDLLALLDVPRVIDGPFTGETSATGELSPLALNIGLDGYFEKLGINDGYSLEIVELTNLATNISATVIGKTIDIRKARLSQPNLDIEAFGEIFLKSPVELDLTSNIKRINLLPLSPIVGLSFDGNGQAALSVDGPADDITVSGSAHLKDFALEGLKFGTFRSAVLFKENQIELPNLTLLRGEGVARGKVIVDIMQPAVDANLDFEEVQINPLLDDLKLAPELLPYVKGRATGNVTLSGPIAELGLTVSASGRDVSFDPLFLPQAHIEAVRVTGPNSPMIFGILAGEQEENVINVEVSSTGNLAIDLKLEDYPFANLIIPSLKNRLGQIDLSADLDGPIDGLNGTVSLTTSECRIDTVDLGDGRGELLFNDGEFKGSLAFPANAIEATASGQVGDKIPVSTTILFEDLEPLRWVDPTTDIGLKTTGSVFIQGDLTDLPALTADANLTAAALNWQGINGTLERAAVISYASEKFRVAELDMNLDGLLVSAMGEVPLEGSQSLQLRVLGNAGGLRPLFGSVESLSGDIDGFIDISGEIAEPQFSGSLTMRDISGKEPTLGLRFTDGVGRMTLIDRDLLIDSATLKTGDGTVSVLGKITFLPEFKPQLQLTLNQAKLKPYPSSEAVVSGELQVSQPRGILVSGALEVNRATYGENVDLSRLFVRQPNMSFGTNIEEEPWDLRVQLSAPQGIFVSNNMVEAELRADLTVRGNTKRMGLIGSVVPLNGTVSYGGNEFEVESGSFDFTDEYAIRPNYATKLRADACGMDLQVNLSGEAERFIVEASGEDETGIVDARDALLCAQFGIGVRNPTSPRTSRALDSKTLCLAQSMHSGE